VSKSVTSKVNLYWLLQNFVIEVLGNELGNSVLVESVEGEVKCQVVFVLLDDEWKQVGGQNDLAEISYFHSKRVHWQLKQGRVGQLCTELQGEETVKEVRTL
jgi:hypothetical protein